MGWNGSGTFNRIFSWTADKAAGLDISSSRMDSDTNDIASQGFGNCLTRDGQGQPTTNLPMATFRHTNVGNAVARTDYTALGQAQDGLANWTSGSVTSDAYTATYTPALTTLADGQLCFFRAAGANTTTTPTFAPNGLTAHPITKIGGTALAVADIQASQEVILRYNLTSTRWELMNPSNVAANQSLLTTGAVVLTLATSAPAGWLLFNDGTFGSGASGAGYASDTNLLLFTMFFNNVSDTNAPLLTSTGAATTRAGQGTAAAAWAANCRMSLPKMLGRALAVAGSGSGLTARALGQTLGEESHTLTLAEIPTGITSSGSNTISVSNAGLAGIAATSSPGNVTLGNITAGPGSAVPVSTAGSWFGNASMAGSNTISVTSNNTNGSTHNNMQPSVFLNAIIKQ